MINDLTVIEAINDLYNGVKFDYLIDGSMTEGVYVGIRYISGNTLVIYRGSTTTRDWAKDFFAVPHESVEHPQLGPLHAGFALGSTPAWKIIKPLIVGDVIVGGHSLGGAQAIIGTGEMVIDGIMPKATVVFGCPKPGFKQLSDVVAPVPLRPYRNCDDLITHVPFKVLNLNFVEDRVPIDTNVPPKANDPWGHLGAHHHELYLAATQKLTNIPVIIE